MHLIWMRYSLMAILLYFEDAAKQEVKDEAEMHIGMLNDTFQHQTVAEQDVIFARHTSLIANLSSLLDSKNELWPLDCALEFPVMVEVVLKPRFRKPFDGYGTPTHLTSPDTMDGYMALSRDVEKSVGVMVQTLGTPDMWYVR
jgi:hypothetical protein